MTTQTPGQRVDAAMSSTRPRRYTDPNMLPIVSPWSTSDFQRFLWQDFFGTPAPANTRESAMKLPALARSRNLLVSTICRLPLRQLEHETPTPEQAPWFTQTGDGSTPQHRLAWTVDDLIFYGWSCWWRTNDSAGVPQAMARLNQDEWKIDDDNNVVVDGTVVRDPSQVMVIPGLHEGILSFGADTLEDARLMYQTVKQRLLNPVPQVDLHQTEGEPLGKTDRDELIALWAAARQGRNGGVSYTSPTIQPNEMGKDADAQLMIEARNAAAVDLCRLVGVTASRVDATAPTGGGSMRYETTMGRNQELVDFDLALYMTPITARASLDDVTPPGQRVDFDIQDFVSKAASVVGPDMAD